MRNKTAVYILHRLARIQNDYQRGTHEELVNVKNGKYAEMWQAQARYYEDGAMAGEAG